MKAELGYGLICVRQLGNEKHVFLGPNDGSESLAKNRMIFYGQKTDWLCEIQFEVSSVLELCRIPGIQSIRFERKIHYVSFDSG
jgi:hypothetical protein